MATRDYVKRGKGSRKSVPRRKTPSRNHVFSMKGRILLLVLLVFVFTYFIYNSFTKKAQETNIIAPQELKSTIVVKPKKDEADIPPKPEEKWSYIETLENKKVQVDVNTQEISERPYLLQCGAYKDETYAQARKANIAFQGLESQIIITEIESGVWYRVVLGPYDLKRKAESDRNLLRRAGIEPCKIWFWED